VVNLGWVMNNQLMRKISLIVLVLVLSTLSTTSAPAALKSTKIIAVLDAHLAQVNSDHKKALSEADKTYQPMIFASQKQAEDAFTRLKSLNKATVVKIGNNRGYWGQFECPEKRPNCIGVDKGPEFQIGDSISFKEITLKDVDQLYVNQLIIQDGLVEMVNASGYNSAADSFRKAMSDLSLATLQLAQAKASANTQHADGLSITESIKIAKIAARRADKNPASYEKSFVTSYVFESNREGLRRYASTPFSQINSLKALDDVIEITKLSKQADQIAARYSLTSAAKFNKICGSTFTGEPEFKADFRKIAELFKKATNTNLSLKA
jgi:hypothetical protein